MTVRALNGFNWNRMTNMLRMLALRSSLLVVLLMGWQLATMAAKAFYFPTPLTILDHAQTLWLSGPLSHGGLTLATFRDVIPSIGRLLAGWALAVAFGVALGTLIGRVSGAADFLTPAIDFLRTMPSPALIPVFLILLGTGSSMRVTLIAFGSVWPVLLNTIEGISTVDPSQLDIARLFRLPPSAQLLRIMLPSAMPKICAGMRVALAISVILMVVSELVASSDGIGHQIANDQQLFKLADMWAGILLVAFIGFALNVLFSIGERRVLRWHRYARRRGDDG